MKRAVSSVFFFLLLSAAVFAADKAPLWVTEPGRAFPESEWISVVHAARTRDAAQNAAYNDLAVRFRVDVLGLETASRQFAQVVSETDGKKSVGFAESSAFARDVSAETNVSGLIGVVTDFFTAPDGTVYANARMNRKECGARYSAMIRENAAVISSLEAEAAQKPNTFDAYAALNLAVPIAEVTDNFLTILEVLDASATSRRPGYGGVNAVKQLRQKCAQGITIGLEVDVHGEEEAVIVTRAFGSFFKDRGFKTNDSGKGIYVLRGDLLIERTETSATGPKACRYYLNAELENADGDAVFSFSGNQRQNHNNMSEAYRRALRAAEASIKTGQFAAEFDAFLISLIG
jgi:hypothetical protein